MSCPPRATREPGAAPLRFSRVRIFGPACRFIPTVALLSAVGCGRASDDRGRRDRASDRGLGRGHDPIGGRAQSGRGRRPNSRQSSVPRRGEALPSARRRREDASNSRHAICSAFPPGTNSPRPIQNPALALAESRPLRAEEAALRSGSLRKPARATSARRRTKTRQPAAICTAIHGQTLILRDSSALERSPR